jgi:protease YdgD
MKKLSLPLKKLPLSLCCFALGLIAVLSLTSLLPVQAQSPVFVSAQEAEMWPTLSFAEFDPEQPFTEPAEPRIERAIVCQPGQLPSECDDRTPMTDRRQPWSAIGRIAVQTSGLSPGYIHHCSGTLIAADWILTNAHCIVNPATHQPYSETLVFEPNLINGVLRSSRDRARLTYGIYGTDFSDDDVAPHPQDWALVKLDRPLGSQYGTIPMRALSMDFFRTSPNSLALVGYSGDFPAPNLFPNLRAGIGKTPAIHSGCGVTDKSTDGVLIHNCDMRPGASGGPILAWTGGRIQVVAINSAEFANQQTGIGPYNYATDVSLPLGYMQRPG